ncbi:MAG: helicase-exonuclease AddAB subunit AddA [Planctomycetota bacterium]
MADKRMEWTEQQKRAIDARGSDVIVAASAGTGKTAVLSGRCVNIVSDKSICPDVWSILVLTFTEAAAEQMRSRIADKLKDAFLENRNPHLRRQLMLLQGADISTIHSFCKRLITEHFYRLDLDPTFSVIDSDEQRLLKAEVLEKTIDLAWQEKGLRASLEKLLYRRDLRTNDGFLMKIIDISDFLDGVISRDSWYERAVRLSEVADPFTTDLGDKQKQIIANRLKHVLAQVRHAIRLCESQNTSGNWITKWNETFAEPVAGYIELIETGSWEKFSEAIRHQQKPSRLEYKPRGLSGPVAEAIKSTAEDAKRSFDELFDFAILNEDYLDRLGASVGLQTRVLVELVRKFDELYGRAKRAINCLDFADLEHYALRLLTDGNSGQDEPTPPGARPSATALALRQRYKYLFVDEYQDINAVQQQIIDMLSTGGNMLGVGDAKQSIYAFRGAQPDIFLERLNLASPNAMDVSRGLRVDLNANFRSAKGILDFVNATFSRIMTTSFTRIDYDESARLRPAFDDQSESPAESVARIVEFHILDEEKADAEDSQQEHEIADSQYETGTVTARQRQAAMIARRIRQIVGADTGKPEFQIYDTEQQVFRDVDYRDIVVLMRSLAKKANDYVEVFRLAGVPCSCQATAGYFEATEISDVTALLKVLDNPQRDIELAAILRSPLFKVGDTELAKIKIHSAKSRQHKDYYDCVLQYCRSGSDPRLADRLTQILGRLDKWRTIARRGNLADLIWRIYRETDYLSFVSALPNGQVRRANLLRLHDRAIQFEGFASSAGVPSLTRFVEFIEKLQEMGQDWAPAEPQASAGNAVRILSVHKSKGLEFPVVFLAELESNFNKRDVYADCLADADDTLGLQIIDRQSNGKLSSLAHEVIAEQKFSTALAEEMRVLYVATTRARERLILTASEKQKNCRQIISKGLFFDNKPVPDWQLRSCRSHLEWILYGLSGRKILHETFETGLERHAVDDNLFSFTLHDQAELKELSEFVVALKTGKSKRASARPKKSRPKQEESNLLAQVKRALSWRYRPGDAPLLPAKSSVTQLTHNSDQFVRIDYSRALDRRPAAVMTAEQDLGGPPDARLIGTATHLVISELDLASPVTIEAIERTKEELMADNSIDPTVAEHIDTESVLAFFQSDLGKLALDSSNTVWREWPFTFALPACEWKDSYLPQHTTYDPSTSLRTSIRDTIIVQGIIDMLVRTAAGLVVIDFKTDKITAGQTKERTERYRRQLELYSRAASAILKAKPLAGWLYFLTPRCIVEV